MVLGRIITAGVRRSRGPGWALASQLVSSGGNFALTAILVRSIGLADFGRFSMVFLVLMIVRNFLIAFLLNPLSAIFPKLRSASAYAYRGFSLALCTTFATLCALVIFAVCVALPSFGAEQWIGTVAFPLSATSFVANVADFFQRSMFARDQVRGGALIDVVRFSAILGLAFGLFFVNPVLLNVNIAVWIIFAGNAVALAYGAARYKAVLWRRKFSIALWKRHWRMSRYMVLTEVFYSALGPGMILFAGLFLAPAALGGVRAMQVVANVLMLPVNALQHVAASAGARVLHSVGVRKFYRFQKRLLTSLLTLTVIMSLGVAVTSNYLVVLAVGEFRPELNSVLILFSIANIAAAAYWASSISFQCLEKTFAALAASVAMALASPLLFLGAIRHFGADSVPLVRVLVVATGAIALWLELRHTIKKSVGSERASVDGAGPVKS